MLEGLRPMLLMSHDGALSFPEVSEDSPFELWRTATYTTAV